MCVQLVNFAFVPMHFRIPYVAGVSFGWTVILSVMQGALVSPWPVQPLCTIKSRYSVDSRLLVF